jgi:hypothetical protein
MRCYPRVPKILLLQLSHLLKFLFASIPFEAVPFCIDTIIPEGFPWSAVQLEVISHQSPSCPVIWSESPQCCQNIAPWASISSLGIRKDYRGRGSVSREGGGWLLCLSKPKTATQQVTSDCHEVGSRGCRAKCLDVRAVCCPSIASECCNRIFHSPSVVVEKIPYAQCPPPL